MRARLLRLADTLRESYWFVPTLMAIAALLLAAGMVWLDSHQMSAWMDQLPWLYAARPAGARSLLSSIGGSMIGVAGTTFSVTIAAVVYASGQYGPRLLSNFMSDRGNQVTLGTFIATFLYSLVVVRTIRSPGESADAAAFVPQLAVLVGVLLVLCSIGVLIYFIHHVPSRIHINSVIERIGTRLLSEIAHRFPHRGEASEEVAAGAMRHDFSQAVAASQTGYIQLIDEDALIDTARRHDLVLRLQYRPGDFAHRASTLAEVGGAELTDGVATTLRDAFAIGARRTALQDLHFLIDELVEIAARALSPGVNDPFTAASCLDWLGAALADLSTRTLPSRGRVDRDGDVRLVTRPVTYAGFVSRAFGALLQYAAADMIAARHYLAVLGDVALHCDAPDRLAALRDQIERLRGLAAEALTADNRAAVLRDADDLLAALAAGHHQQRLRDRRAAAEDIA